MDRAMAADADLELLDFAGWVLERRGALVERRFEGLMALLPDPLSSELEMPEEMRLGRDGEPFFYGSPLLDRLVNLATANPPLVYGEVRIPYIKKEGFEARLDEDFSFHKIKTRVINRAESRLPYMILACRYVALSDERKEGLVEVSVQEESGAVIPGLKKDLSHGDVEFFPKDKDSTLFQALPECAVQAALAEARRMIGRELSGFLKSMGRHLRRDVENTREYYRTLEKEMRQSLKDRHIAPDPRKEREAKIKELPLERDRKLEDLHEKYNVHVTVTACTGLRLLVPVAQLSLALKHRAFVRRITVTFNTLTRRLDPLTCERCGKSTRRPVPRSPAPNFRLDCEACAGR